MSNTRFPAMMIGFKITRKDGSIHEGKFRFDDDVERRRFGESTKSESFLTASMNSSVKPVERIEDEA